MSKRRLLLEDNTSFIGKAFGGRVENNGKVVVYTGMTGYQEILTDPSYAQLLVTFTYPHIGAAGINRDDFESIRPHVNGVLAKEIALEPSNFRSTSSFHEYLKENNIPGIMNVDTRKLARKIRMDGPLEGIITDDLDRTYAELRNEHIEEKDCITSVVSTKEPYVIPGDGNRLIVIDLGIKQTVLRELAKRDFHITVVPYNYKAEQIKNKHPEGVIISHGPGNPASLSGVEETIRSLLGKVPLLSLGLGHQLFAQACSCKIEELEVTRYGTNFPVKDLLTDQTWITTESTSYVVRKDSVDKNELQIIYQSVNDHFIEGLSHRKHPAVSAQFNIEGSPGTNETSQLLDSFVAMMKRHNKGSEHHA